MLVFFLIAIFVTLLYFAIGLLINKSNARYLLAGYNTMSDEQRNKFPIDAYLIFFKRFFIRMSFFTLFSAIFFYFVLGEKDGIMLWAIFQIIPHIYFVFQSLKY
jgi:hypothetical protein